MPDRRLRTESYSHDLRMLRHPYVGMEPFRGFEPPSSSSRPSQGSALVWELGSTPSECERLVPIARDRPGGVALIVVLPPTDRITNHPVLFEIMERCRPYSILPFHPNLGAKDVLAVLRRAPREFHIELSDYLSWRGISLSVDTRRILRRVFELSRDIRTVNGVARAVYLSRRALGRRFAVEGVPVPSHWLHFARVLRSCIHLQNTEASLFDIACSLGYTDGFALSNQMARLTGLRPSDVRDRPGWEWVAECWIERERKRGGFCAERHPFLGGARS